ncbi:MAG TPA: two-component system activity regulator YycH, partial [Bacillales bacterium]|nr:two-component system activity regulator YycH [Bacillales bacterium]
MNWEGFKTLLLTILVALSLILTWNLWTYQFKYRTAEDATPPNTALAADGKKNVSDVVHPIKAIYHEKEMNHGIV